MIAELKEYATSSPPPHNAREVMYVVEYLEVCNKLFECEFLGHVCISTYPNAILNNMDEGFSFFTEWFNSLLVEGKSCV